MPPPNRQDDPALSGDLVLLRRIPPWSERVQWGPDGKPTASSQNFRDKDDELSTYIAVETTADTALLGHDGFGLIHITAGQIRGVFAKSGRPVIVCRDTEEPDNGHVLVCGKVTHGMSNQMGKLAQWVEGKWPARIPPPPK
jgi:hypothetical protein